MSAVAHGEPAPEIPRGPITIPCRPKYAVMLGDKLTFSSTSLAPGYLLTYHDADVMSVQADKIIAFVGPRDVVTWDRLP